MMYVGAWRRLGLAVVVLLFTLLVAVKPAKAERPVIEAGRERETLALFLPFELASEVAGGWKLWNVRIDSTWIEVEVAGPGGDKERFRLVHPNDAPAGSESTRSFGVERKALSNGAAKGAIDELVARVRANDSGGFWRVKRAVARPSGYAQADTASWLRDGLTGLALLSIAFSVLAVRLMSGQPRWMRWGLPLLVGGGGVLRLLLAKDTALGAWPWSRFWPHAKWVYEGPTFSLLAAKLGVHASATEVIAWVGFSYAVVMPLVLFCHASYLLRDTRAGMAAAVVVAFLPQHIKFSRCEDAFIPSLVLTSAAFALLHGFLRERSTVARWLCFAALPVVLYAGYLLRPLNILFIGVYAVGVILVHANTATRPRQAMATAMIIGVGALALVEMLRVNRDTVAEAVRFHWLWSVPSVLIDTNLNTLLNMSATPPVLVGCAGFGTYVLWKSGEQRLVLFLVGWLLAFFVAHGYVVVPEMQPRYHLHLVVPFVLLCASAAKELYARSRPAFGIVVACVVVSPILHAGWIRDTAYADTIEYDRLRVWSKQIPSGCTVVEYVGRHGAHNARFARLSMVNDGVLKERFVSEALTDTDATRRLAELRAAPPDCLYLYRGLPCWGARPEGSDYAPACVAMAQQFPVHEVAKDTLPARSYDGQAAGGVPQGAGAVIRLDRAVTGQ